MITAGSEVEHPELGLGTVRRLLGSMAVVDFFGEEIDLPVSELVAKATFQPEPQPEPADYDSVALSFRQAFEAMNLGVVPPKPAELISLTIGGKAAAQEIEAWLAKAKTDGLCRVFFGYYGSGKSHHLQLVKAAALRRRWVTAYLEFDPKSADPAKPHLVYQGLMNGLTFPEREDGSRIDGYYGLIKEMRTRWGMIRDGRYFKDSVWFKPALEVLMTVPHSDETSYSAAVGWLFGQNNALTEIRGLAKRAGRRATDIPPMPRVKETAEIYVYHLVVLNEVCRALGYEGLAIIVDEAEHVNGFNVRRRERANNLFDLLARAAHKPLEGDTPPIPNDHVGNLPPYWKQGPHFSLFVGLTEGDTFADSTLPLREACVFLHEEEDRVRLTAPDAAAYRTWCENYFALCHLHLGGRMLPIASAEDRARLAAELAEAFDRQDEGDRVMRLWIKLASLAPAALLAGHHTDVHELAAQISEAVRRVTGDELPWD